MEDCLLGIEKPCSQSFLVCIIGMIISRSPLRSPDRVTNLLCALLVWYLIFQRERFRIGRSALCTCSQHCKVELHGGIFFHWLQFDNLLPLENICLSPQNDASSNRGRETFKLKGLYSLGFGLAESTFTFDFVGETLSLKSTIGWTGMIGVLSACRLRCRRKARSLDDTKFLQCLDNDSSIWLQRYTLWTSSSIPWQLERLPSSGCTRSVLHRVWGSSTPPVVKANRPVRPWWTLDFSQQYLAVMSFDRV